MILLWRSAISRFPETASVCTIPARKSAVIILLLAASFTTGRAQDVLQSVSPFIGTGGHGHTFPGATLPFGMVQLSPDTRVVGWDACGGYHYSDSVILGFSHTHLSGTGVPDYGDILLMPKSGPLRGEGGAVRFSSRFRHERESARPGYYSVQLDDWGVRAELTATRRTGIHRYTFPRNADAYLLIDLVHGLGPDHVQDSRMRIAGDREISGMRRSAGWAKDQVLYFAARFSRPFTAARFLTGNSLREGAESTGKEVRCIVDFNGGRDEPLMVKVGISSVSEEGARRNLDAEAPGWDFDAIRAAAESSWREELGKILIEGGTKDQRTIFYTALYHAMIAPNLYSDADGSYRGMDGKIHKADGFEMHTVFSLWDTFRAEHPLLAIIDRKRTKDFVLSLLAKYDEAQLLPVWELASNETYCMIGYHSVPVIVDAYLKGIRGFDARGALDAMIHSATRDHFGLKYYRACGYIPGDKESESVSKTLEYAYDDWCIARFAREIGAQKEAAQYEERSRYYRSLYDPATGLMRPILNGSRLQPFDPFAVTMHYTEANPWQYSFFAPHAVNDLIRLHGGDDRFIAKLDTLFRADSRLSGRVQADITGMIGQYAHGNEPSHHMAYLYTYAGAPWKTQELVRRIMDSLYMPGPDGICGNDDCGQMSAWYVLSALGFYPVNPGQEMYCIGSPLFPRATVRLENGRHFEITAVRDSPEAPFISAATLNGAPYRNSFLTHEAISAGGAIVFRMSDAPGSDWGTQPDKRPASPPEAAPFVPAPLFSGGPKSFTGSRQVTISGVEPGGVIFYTLDGREPSTSSRKYISPITLTESATIKAFIRRPDGVRSKTSAAEYILSHPVGTITHTHPPSPQYSGGGDQALLDGIRGEADFRLGAWQGFERTDLDAVIDLGEAKEITEVWLGCLQDNNSWIFFPTQVEFSFSNNNYDFADGYLIPNKISPKEEKPMLKDFGTHTRPIKARYVRVTARNMGFCPEWHKGAGGKAWIFADEIVITIR